MRTMGVRPIVPRMLSWIMTAPESRNAGFELSSMLPRPRIAKRHGTARGAAPSHTGSRDLRRLARREGLNIRGPQRLAADGPISALELVDTHPGHRAHALAFHLDHGLGHLGNELLLLHGGENVFDHIDRHEWHVRFSRASAADDPRP